MNAPATRLFSDVPLSDVFLSISFEKHLPPLAPENKLPNVETFLQIKFFPSQKCRTQSLNVIMVLWPPRVGEAISTKILKLRPWVKDLRSFRQLWEDTFCSAALSGTCLSPVSSQDTRQHLKFTNKPEGWRCRVWTEGFSSAFNLLPKQCIWGTRVVTDRFEVIGKHFGLAS